MHGKQISKPKTILQSTEKKSTSITNSVWGGDALFSYAYPD
jgi:hypothetical protein